MLKLRYFQIRLPCSFLEFARLALAVQADSSASDITVIKHQKKQIDLSASFTRYIATRTFATDGSVVVANVPTVDTYRIKLFAEKNKFFLSCADPPRGSRFISDIFTKILGNDDYFFQAVELDYVTIEKYIAHFNSFKLVSAKVRDFHVYDGAVGRLEISSQDGLMDGIAPFLKGKHYKVDALTYSVSQGMSHGLIYFSRNGTLRVSDAFGDVAIPLFEQVLVEPSN